MTKVFIQQASGRSKCRQCNQPYGSKLIPKGTREMVIFSDTAQGTVSIYLCNKHAHEFAYEVEQIGQIL